MNHCRAITSTVATQFWFPYLLVDPPATTRDLPLHTAAVDPHLVGMGGNLSVHLLSVRLRSELVCSLFGIFPPMAVRRLLTIARLT